MNITYRPASVGDLESAVRLVQLAINDLRMRHGLPPTAPLRPPAFQNFCLSEDGSELWIANSAEEIVGFSFSWMIEDFWYLAQLFVRPHIQSKGVGQALLLKAGRQAERLRARNRTLITFAYNTASTGLYVRHGMYPRVPLYRMLAPASHLRQHVIKSACEVAPIAISSGLEDWVGLIDEAVLGFRRDPHHSFLLGSGSHRAVRIMYAGKPVGYAYISQDGHIGPLGVARAADAGEAIRAVIACALEGQPQNVSMIVPGPANMVMDAVTQLGFRVDDALVLMSARPFGKWSNYLPSNPGYM